MTVRAILDTKGHQIVSVRPEAKVTEAIEILGERKQATVIPESPYDPDNQQLRA